MKLLRWNLNPTQHYLVWIRLQRKISFVTSFTNSKWLKKYYFRQQISSIGIKGVTIYYLVSPFADYYHKRDSTLEEH